MRKLASKLLKCTNIFVIYYYFIFLHLLLVDICYIIFLPIIFSVRSRFWKIILNWF